MTLETDPEVWADIIANCNDHLEDDENDLKLSQLPKDVPETATTAVVVNSVETIENVVVPKKRRYYNTVRRKNYAKLLDESSEISNEAMIQQIKNTEDIVVKNSITKIDPDGGSFKYNELIKSPCRALRPKLSKYFLRNLREIGEDKSKAAQDKNTDSDIVTFDDDESITDEHETSNLDETNSQSEASEYNFDAQNDIDSYSSTHSTSFSFRRPEKSKLLQELDRDFKPTILATRSYARKSTVPH